MKKLSFLGILLFCGFLGYTQETMVLDDAIRDSVDFFSSSLQSGSTVAVTNFEAETKDLSDFIIEELLVAFANTGKVRVVERSRLEILEAELNFNMSGSVSDETAQGIGRMTGAQILFSGSISEYRDMYRMRVQAIVIETAEVIGTRTINIKYDPTLTGLLGKINPADAWKHQWLYAGVNVGYSARIMGPDIKEWGYYFAGVPFAYSFYALFQPFDFFGIAVDFGGEMLEGPVISVLPTLTIRPASFEIDLFMGVGLPVLESTSASVAILGGVRGGYKVGPGVIYAEVRPMFFIYPPYEGDWYPGIYHYDGGGFSLNISLGYQLGFFPRKK
jgi:hypothetical protein